MRRPKKASRRHICFEFFAFQISRSLCAFLSRVTHESDQLPREETGTSHLYTHIFINKKPSKVQLYYWLMLVKNVTNNFPSNCLS